METELITASLLCDLYESKDKTIYQAYAPLLDNYCRRYLINEGLRLPAFLAQIGHESNRLRAVSENLNYSARGLRATWPRIFATDAIAKEYERKPQAIANRAYANRLGNGSEESGDGWRYRGRGFIQITGKDNYRALQRAIGDEHYNFINNPDLLTIPLYAVWSACWWWYAHNLNQIADTGNFAAVTKRINGGYNGQADREALYNRARRLLGR